MKGSVLDRTEIPPFGLGATEAPCQMHTPDETGHVTFGWDPAKPDEVAEAEKHFKAQINDGKEAYKTTTVATDVKTGAALTEFDAQAGRLLFVAKKPVGGYPGKRTSEEALAAAAL